MVHKLMTENEEKTAENEKLQQKLDEVLEKVRQLQAAQDAAAASPTYLLSTSGTSAPDEPSTPIPGPTEPSASSSTTATGLPLTAPPVRPRSGTDNSMESSWCTINHQEGPQVTPTEAEEAAAFTDAVETEDEYKLVTGDEE